MEKKRDELEKLEIGAKELLRLLNSRTFANRIPADSPYALTLWTFNNNEFKTIISQLIMQNLHLQLIELHISEQGDLTDLPPSIGQLVNLKKLNCRRNGLTTLPDSIGNLTALEYLDCSSNKLTSLPGSLGNLTGLKKFGCYENKLTTLPDSLGQLTSLTLLHCYSNYLTALPDSIGHLTALEYLVCSGNMLTRLPDTIGQLPALKLVKCADNPLTTSYFSLHLFMETASRQWQTDYEALFLSLQNEIQRFHQLWETFFQMTIECAPSSSNKLIPNKLFYNKVLRDINLLRIILSHITPSDKEIGFRQLTHSSNQADFVRFFQNVKARRAPQRGNFIINSLPSCSIL